MAEIAKITTKLDEWGYPRKTNRRGRHRRNDSITIQIRTCQISSGLFFVLLSRFLPFIVFWTCFTMYSTWNMVQLKAELRKRGAILTGKKANLIERLESYDRNSNFGHIEAESQSSTQMDIPSADSYRDVNSTAVLPAITKQHIQAYFDRFQKSIIESNRLYENRYLMILRYCTTADGHTFIKGFCKAQMKQLQYEIDVKLSEDGEPLEAQCECAAGKGNEAHCKHVGVVLLGVANMSQQKYIILNEVSTQKLQTFHQPAKKYLATPLKATKLPTKRNLNNSVFSPYPLHKIDKKVYNINFRNKVINFIHSSMPFKQLYEPANPVAIENDHLYDMDSPTMKILKSYNLVDTSKEKVFEIEKATRGQHQNKKWHEHRQVRITASSFYAICHLRETTMPTYARQMLNKVAFKSKACAHGFVNEGVAIKMYEEKTGLSVEKCGLYISLERPYLGASPDGLLGSETIIEVKCPYSVRHREVTARSVPYLCIENGRITLKRNNIYYYQIQGQLYVTGRKYCNLIVYTFKSLEVIFIDRDDSFIEEMLKKLDYFYINYFKNAFLEKMYYRNYAELIKK